MKLTVLLLLSLSIGIFHSTQSRAEIKGLFGFSKGCGKALYNGPNVDNRYSDPFPAKVDKGDYVSCATSYPFQLITDLVVAPFILSAAATNGETSDAGSSERQKEQVKQYKQTMLYAVSTDAIHYAASPEHEPSIELSKFIESLMQDFPGESAQEINSRIIATHIQVLSFLGEQLGE